MRSVPPGDKRGRNGTWYHDARGLTYSCAKCGASMHLHDYYIQLRSGSVYPDVTCVHCGTREAICLDNWEGWQWR